MSLSEKIDRNATTPFLLKLFYKNGRHNSADDYHPMGPNPPHVEIYTWMSATCDELTHLISENLPQLLPDPAIGTRLDFELVFPDMKAPPRSDGYGRFQKKTLGSVVIGAGGPGAEMNGDVGRRGSMYTGEEGKSLADAKFVIGDHIDCAIYPPLPNGDIAVPARSVGGRGPPPRENGYSRPLYEPRRGGPGRGGGLPPGEWRRGDPVPPSSGGYGRRGGRGRGW